MRRSYQLKTLIRGIFIGIADLIPGVSGGTVAIIVGVYKQLITGLSRINAHSIKLLLRWQIKEIWIYVNAPFLLLILCGALIGIYSFANTIHWLLTQYPFYLYAFFMGIVGCSVYILYRQYQHRAYWYYFVIGTLISIGIGLLPQMQLSIAPPFIVLSAAIAITAMLLPGISGSFLLLLLGVYPEYVRAVSVLDWQFIGYFFLGSVLGVLSFSRLLKYLLTRFEQATMHCMTGFIAGSLPLLWPFKSDYSGHLSLSLNVLPQTLNFSLLQILFALSLAVGGFAILWIINNLSKK